MDNNPENDSRRDDYRKRNGSTQKPRPADFVGGGLPKPSEPEAAKPSKRKANDGKDGEPGLAK